jgi:hypothetical protein
MLFGMIRWNKKIGNPAGDPCGGFHILVEVRPPRTGRHASGFHLLTNAPFCSVAPDQGDYSAITFNVPDVHLQVLDGMYRITPKLTGNWIRSPFQSFFGYLAIEPLEVYVQITKDAPVQMVSFEVVRRSHIPWLG